MGYVLKFHTKGRWMSMASSTLARQVRSLLLLLLLAAGIPARAADDPPAVTYRANASEVQLTFSAIDRNDHGVATLQASDFAIVDRDFIVRNFQSFNRSDWTKLEIGVLVDTSESVTPRFHQEIADILQLLSQTQGVPEENISVFTFRDLKPSLLCAGDCRSTHADERLPAAHAGGFTPLFDALVFASDSLAQRGDARAEKILILFSDGEDTISRNSLRDALDSAVQNDVQIHCIDQGDPNYHGQGVGVLQTLANATGGRYFSAPDGATRAVNVILEGFRATYTVSYRLPSHVSGFHSVRILPTHNLNLQFRSRSGYYYPNQTR